MASLSKEARVSSYPKGFKHGVNIQGIPLNVVHPGEVFWVDENAKSPSNAKATFANPCVSIETCMDLCKADRGDVIMVKPGHVENISAAAALTCDIAGVAIVGCGVGGKQAKFQFDTGTGAIIDIEADNITIANMWFNAEYAAIAVGINVDADHFTVQGCRVTDTSASYEWTTFIAITADSDHFHFVGNDCRQLGTSGASVISTVGESTAMLIKDNFIAAMSTAAVLDLDATAITEFPILTGNTIVNLDTTTGLCVTVDSSTVALFSGESYGANKSNVTPVEARAGSYFVDCHGVDLDDTYSIIFPETVAT